MELQPMIMQPQQILRDTEQKKLRESRFLEGLHATVLIAIVVPHTAIWMTDEHDEDECISCRSYFEEALLQLHM